MNAQPDAAIAARIDANKPAGELAQGDDGRWTLTMTRVLAHPPERVWQWLTDPDRLARWSPVVPDRALDAPGPASSRETPDAPRCDATVLATDGPRELVHRWGGHTLRWTLTPTPDGTRLRLEQTFAERRDAGSFGGGWHVCLAGLAASLDGEDVERPVGQRALAYGWERLRDAYDAHWARAAKT